MAYGDALAADVRLQGDVPVMSSGGVTGSHDSANTLGPCVVIGRKGSYGSVHWSSQPAYVIDTAYYIDSRSTECDLRWLYYALQSVDLRGISQDVGVPGLSREAAYAVEMPDVPSLHEQRRIAAFLDAQTALLDRAIALRQEQKALLAEHHEAEIESRIRPDGADTPEGPARFLVDRIGVGIVIQPAALYTEDEDSVPAIRGKDISPGRVAPVDTLVRLTRQGHNLNRRSELKAGDIVVVRSGKAGAAAQVPDELVGANCVDVVIVRPGPHVSPRYLEHSINCRRGQESIVEHSVGAIQRHFGVEDMKALPLVPRDLPDQQGIGRSLDALTDKHRRADALLDESLGLLKERRQALITAAVWNEFDVTTARSVA